MAERSIKAGYLKDALQYLQLAHEADPGDFDIMLKLGWTLNILHKDRDAFRWFDLAANRPTRAPLPRPRAHGAVCGPGLHVYGLSDGFIRFTPRAGMISFHTVRSALSSARRLASAHM